ncbi:MAG: IPT/TIG domain-containing protein [Thermoanaerobaculia bacterium]
MKKLIALAVSLLALPFAVFAQDHMLMTPEDFRAFAAANSRHGAVIPQPLVISPTAAVKEFTITAKRFVFTVSPTPFEVNQGDTVTLNITVPANDGSAHGVLMNTYVEPGITVNVGATRSTQFTATTVGTFGFVCTVSSCGSGHSNMTGTFLVKAAANPAPVINAVTPTSGPTTGGTTVSIAGGNFQTGATVRFGGVAATGVNVTSSSNLTAVTPSHAVGAVDVVVTNPDGQAVAVSGAFTYTTPVSGPSITSVAPNEGPTSGGTALTISGNGFLAGATVTVGGLPAFGTVVVSSTRITAQSPLGPANEQISQPRDVVVTNPDGTRATAAASFTYRLAELAVSKITPGLSLLAGGSTIQISGAGFTSALASSVTIGGVAATNVQIIDAITISARVPAHAAGSTDVVVTVGGKSVTARGGLLYVSSISRRRATK